MYFVDCFAVLKELNEKLIKLYKECVYYEWNTQRLVKYQHKSNLLRKQSQQMKNHTKSYHVMEMIKKLHLAESLIKKLHPEATLKKLHLVESLKIDHQGEYSKEQYIEESNS